MLVVFVLLHDKILIGEWMDQVKSLYQDGGWKDIKLQKLQALSKSYQATRAVGVKKIKLHNIKSRYIKLCKA